MKRCKNSLSWWAGSPVSQGVAGCRLIGSSLVNSCSSLGVGALTRPFGVLSCSESSLLSVRLILVHMLLSGHELPLLQPSIPISLEGLTVQELRDEAHSLVPLTSSNLGSPALP